MKKFILFFAFLGISQISFSQYRTIKQNSFQKGEHLEYLLHLGFLDAGIATIDVEKKLYSVNNRACYKIEVYGKSIGGLEMATKIRDFWRSYVDTAAIAPQRFYRDILEGGYTKKETTLFSQLAKYAEVSDDESKKKTKAITPEYVHDIISGFYFLRTVNYEKYKVGEVFQINGLLEADVYDLKITFLGKEEIKTLLGKMQVYVLAPILPKNQLFRGENAIKVYISADANKVPVKIQANMVAGAVEAELQKFSGLKHSLVFKK
jgi:hypothetical protein